MKLYTKQGDDGETGLIGGARVPKDDPRVVAYGDVDATNAAIGLAVAACEDGEIGLRLHRVQADLFSLGAELATKEGETPRVTVAAALTAQLERWIDDASAEAKPLKSFVLPGGTELAARLHIARTACRLAERRVVALARQQSVDREILVYLNRLSDFLFALARLANHRAGVADVPWIARGGESTEAPAP